jgi:3-hydroxy-9,10-secoandrosta-1,3,5(10)-triene-9,17-dione monooxygenase
MTEPTGAHPAVPAILAMLTAQSPAALRSSGASRMLQPALYGGLALPRDEFVRAVHEVAALDGSLGWLAAMFNAAAGEVAAFPECAAFDVWNAEPDALVTIGRLGSGTLADDRLTGRWTSVVGAEQAHWLLLPAGDRAEYRVLVPRDGVRIEPVGDHSGLGAAGVCDVTASDLLVTERRVFLDDHHAAVTAAAGAAAAVVGSADGVWRKHVEQVRARLATSYGGGGVTDEAAAQVARAASDIDAARLQITTSIQPPEADLASATWACRQAIARARGAADDLLGSSRHALDASDSVSPLWRDVHAGARLGGQLLDQLTATTSTSASKT